MPGMEIVEGCASGEGAQDLAVCADGDSDVASLRGCMVEGYTPEDVNRTFRILERAFGVRLVCLWDYHDTFGFGGNSNFYVEGKGGRLHVLAGDLWRWLNGSPADPFTSVSPGMPASWWGAPADVPDRARHDGLYNYAIEDRDADCNSYAEKIKLLMRPRRDDNPSRLVIRSFLDLSTAHLREETRDNLSSYESVVAYETTYGWLVYASEDADSAEGDDWPSELLPIIKLARANGCEYILFDADAPETDALPTFDAK